MTTNETPVTLDDARTAYYALVRGGPRQTDAGLLWAGIMSHLRGGGRAAIDDQGYVRTWWPK